MVDVGSWDVPAVEMPSLRTSTVHCEQNQGAASVRPQCRGKRTNLSRLALEFVFSFVLAFPRRAGTGRGATIASVVAGLANPIR